MYLIENYKGKYNIVCTATSDCAKRCSHLNTWLNEKQALYTSNGKCTHHNKLWKQYIEALWTQLQQDSGKEVKCERVILNKRFPDKWLIPSCKNSNSLEMKSSCPDPPVAKDQECPSLVVPTCSSCKTVLTTTYVIFGILLFTMYLLRVYIKNNIKICI